MSKCKPRARTPNFGSNAYASDRERVETRLIGVLQNHPDSFGTGWYVYKDFSAPIESEGA